MRNGFHVYDTDTHVMPIAEVLERYVDPDFRSRLRWAPDPDRLMANPRVAEARLPPPSPPARAP